MKADTVIRLEDLGKRYRIGAKQDSHKTLRDTLMNALVSPLTRLRSRLRRPNGNGGGRVPTIWALKGVSFQIKRGEIVGIIGRNGAGKSTLLRILSRITEPTEGWGEIRGRASSLLEVGTGFHPELTGRENVYLNGAILGMRRAEIERKFDAIVAFAEVERFIDTPVKYYSSGMYLRLAFAVAAHLEPDILIVDEVLAVGDANFQKKCLDAMEDVSHRGRTVLFVSHNMSAITRLCERAILLEQGRVIADGPSHCVVGQYLSGSLGATAAREWDDPASAPGGDLVRLRSVRVRSHDGRISNSIDIRRPVFIEMEYEVFKSGFEMFCSYDIFNEEGIHAILALERGSALHCRPRSAGRYLSRVTIPGNFLAEGTFFVHCFLTTRKPFKHHIALPEAIAFQVVDSRDGDSVRGDLDVHLDGVVRPLFDWDTHLVSKGRPQEPARRGKKGNSVVHAMQIEKCKSQIEK